jgi:hypothetical protein
MSQVYARGGFKLVYKGVYAIGQRKNQPCVCKVFITGGVIEERYFYFDLKVVNKALQLIEKFNNAKIITNAILLNIPEIWTFKLTNKKALIEPFIPLFQKFNSNTGWTDVYGTDWSLVMQALSHFTYHVTSGQLLLCDVQGGFMNGTVVLTDPIIMSMRREYGPTDLGREGIVTFFAHHRCNKYCQSDWQRPRDRRTFYQLTKGSQLENDLDYKSSSFQGSSFSNNNNNRLQTWQE